MRVVDDPARPSSPADAHAPNSSSTPTVRLLLRGTPFNEGEGLDFFGVHVERVAPPARDLSLTTFTAPRPRLRSSSKI